MFASPANVFWAFLMAGVANDAAWRCPEMMLSHICRNVSFRIEIERFFTFCTQKFPCFRFIVFGPQPQTSSLWCMTVRTMRFSEKVPLPLRHVEFVCRLYTHTCFAEMMCPIFQLSFVVLHAFETDGYVLILSKFRILEL